jgi:hypothetical protein
LHVGNEGKKKRCSSLLASIERSIQYLGTYCMTLIIMPSIEHLVDSLSNLRMLPNI